MKRDKTDQRGFALLIVLWTLGLLALLGTQLLATARQDTQLARNLVDAAELEAAANGAAQQAIFASLDMSNKHWDADSITRVIRVGHIPVAVQLDDEAEKVNPNIASVALLQALMTALGIDRVTAAAVAASIAEWRQASAVAGGADAVTARYVAARREYAPPGTPFTNLDELEAVFGMTPGMLGRLRPHLTIFTDDDPDMAPRDPIVAQALVLAGQGGTAGVEGVTGLVSITADARGRGRAHFTVHVVVRTNAQAEGRRYEILAHERFWSSGP
ncbi:MAG: type II secretion system protein GspK [Acetobacteraceae bacterium]